MGTTWVSFSSFCLVVVVVCCCCLLLFVVVVVVVVAEEPNNRLSDNIFTFSFSVSFFLLFISFCVVRKESNKTKEESQFSSFLSHPRLKERLRESVEEGKHVVLF